MRPISERPALQRSGDRISPLGRRLHMVTAAELGAARTPSNVEVLGVGPTMRVWSASIS